MFDGVSTTALLIYVSLLVVVLIALTLLVLLIHSGLLRPVEDVGTGKPPIGQVVIAYKFQRGPYGSAGQIFTEAAIIAPDNKALGIYYDDPDKVDSSETRYLVGSILSDNSASVNEDTVRRFADKDYKLATLPEVPYAVQTSFPHITTLSILIAVHKAYPRLKSYIEEHKLCAYPFIEVYDGKIIRFMAPLYKQEEFYVPECHQTGNGDQGSSDGDRTIPNTSLTESGEPCDFSTTTDHDQPQETHDLTSAKDHNEPHEHQNLISATDHNEPHESHVLTSTKDHNEPHKIHELSSAKDHDDSLPQDVQEVTTQPTTAVEGQDIAEENNVNNNALEVNREEQSNEDEEHASDDSSSSFEVLKGEPVE